MSRGFGRMQCWLLQCIGAEPMTFAQILARSYPPGSFEFDMAEALGGSNVAGVRSLRRALAKLCDLDIIQTLGHRRLHPVFVREGIQHNHEAIAALWQILKAEGKESIEAAGRAARAAMSKPKSDAA
jgi:hypothetical protein